MYCLACTRAALLRLSYIAYTYRDVVFLSPFDLPFTCCLLGFRLVGAFVKFVDDFLLTYVCAYVTCRTRLCQIFALNYFKECFAPHHRLSSQTVAFDILYTKRRVREKSVDTHFLAGTVLVGGPKFSKNEKM